MKMMMKMKNRLLRYYSALSMQKLDRTAFGWNQLMDLGIVIGLLFVFISNNATLSTLFTTIVTSIQTVLTNIITKNTTA